MLLGRLRAQLLVVRAKFAGPLSDPLLSPPVTSLGKLCCEFNYVVSFSSFSGVFLHFSSCSFSNSKIAFPFYFAALPCVRTVHALDQYELLPHAICVDGKLASG